MTAPTARDYFERPGIMTLKQAQFLINVGLAGDGGMVPAPDDMPLVVDIVKLGFVFFTGTAMGMPVHIHLTSAGEYVGELVAARIASMMRRPRVFRVLQGGKA